MMKSAKSFKEYFEASFKDEVNPVSAEKLFDEFMDDFIHLTPIKLELLESYLVAGHFNLFYKSLDDLKYLIEFSDPLSRYWFLLRAYSGALAKLKTNQTVKGSKMLYSYYFEKYGDRRMIRNEHWFEKKRWEFLDALQAIYSEHELENFIHQYNRILAENFEIYVSFLQIFIKNIQRIQSRPVVQK